MLINPHYIFSFTFVFQKIKTKKKKKLRKIRVIHNFLVRKISYEGRHGILNANESQL
jgi:hypothetical protein